MVPQPLHRPTLQHQCYTPGVAPAVPLSSIIFDKAADNSRAAMKAAVPEQLDFLYNHLAAAIDHIFNGHASVNGHRPTTRYTDNQGRARWRISKPSHTRTLQMRAEGPKASRRVRNAHTFEYLTPVVVESPRGLKATDVVAK